MCSLSSLPVLCPFSGVLHGKYELQPHHQGFSIRGTQRWVGRDSLLELRHKSSTAALPLAVAVIAHSASDCIGSIYGKQERVVTFRD